MLPAARGRGILPQSRNVGDLRVGRRVDLSRGRGSGVESTLKGKDEGSDPPGTFPESGRTTTYKTQTKGERFGRHQGRGNFPYKVTRFTCNLSVVRERFRGRPGRYEGRGPGVGAPPVTSTKAVQGYSS